MRCPFVRRLSVINLLTLIIGTLALGGQALAQSKTWTGAVNTSWTNAGNWSPTGVPGPADTVLIPAGAGTVSATDTIVVASADIRRPISISGTFTSATTLGSTLTLNGTLSGTLAISAGGSISGSCSGRWSDLTLTTSVPTLLGVVRWNNVTNTGTITMQPGSLIAFEGNQTITGTITAAAVSNSPAYLSPYNAGNNVVTIASGAQVRGAGLAISSSAVFCGSGTLSLVNAGTIQGTNPANPIVIQAPTLNIGSVAGFVTPSGQTFGNTWTVAQPTQVATVTAPRGDPGTSSTQTLSFQDMYVAPNVPFTLGSGETLNLSNGQGTLYISPKARSLPATA